MEDHRFEPGTILNGYVIGEPISDSNQNSRIYNATSVAKGGKYVFKYVRHKVDPRYREGEIRALQLVSRCPHAAVGFDAIRIDDTYGFFMDKFTRGDLLEFVLHNTLTDNQIARIASHVLLALHYLHQEGLAHRDLKLENCLLGGDDAVPDAYLADFGYTARRSEMPGGMFTDPVGTDGYRAPEILRLQPYTESVDIWAFGVMLYAMFVHGLPIPDANRCTDDSEYEIYISECWDYLVEAGASEAACDVIMQCLQVDPQARPTTTDLLKSAFFKDLGEFDVKAACEEIDRAYKEDDARLTEEGMT
jgi:serine/threonine protein kinase